MLKTIAKISSRSVLGRVGVLLVSIQNNSKEHAGSSTATARKPCDKLTLKKGEIKKSLSTVTVDASLYLSALAFIRMYPNSRIILKFPPIFCISVSLGSLSSEGLKSRSQ